MKTIVSLKERSYPILIDDKGSLAGKLTESFPKRKFFLITNTTLEKLYSGFIKNLGEKLDLITHVIPDGEEYKNFETWKNTLDKMLENRLERSSVVIAFGGGVVGDLAGFAASAFLRGVNYVQIPTTLLAMVDSSVGGKTAINHFLGKNLVGAFHQPSLVWIDTSFLETLPGRQFIAGCAELFKYAFIGGNEMFDFIDEDGDAILNNNTGTLREAIKKSVEIKASVVSNDEKEKGERALLNFGHTFGHSLEKYFSYKGILHGEAVIWGMHCAAELGIRVGILDEKHRTQFTGIIKKLPLSSLPGKPDAEELYDIMFSDKKVKSGRIRFILPVKPGTSIIKDDVNKSSVISSINTILKKYNYGKTE